MKKLSIILAAIALASAAAASAAVAGNPHDDGHPDTNLHPHVMMTNFEILDDNGTATPFDDEVSFDQCIDLANNQPVPLEAHHHSLHTGTAGFGNPDVGITRAGHVVYPLQPYEFGLPFADCNAIESYFFG